MPAATYIIATSCGHAMGMGHFFRSLVLAKHLNASNNDVVVLVNEHQAAVEMLANEHISCQVVDYKNDQLFSEEVIINRYQPTTWINDRLDTSAAHASKIISRGIKYVTFDDAGEGAALADLHVAALRWHQQNQMKGRKVLCGTDYLVLNGEISRYRKMRKKLNSMVVCMGGSDTYGVTVDVARRLGQPVFDVTLLIGPANQDEVRLRPFEAMGWQVKKAVSSLPEEFAQHDLAILSGGITAFEASAAGLPALVIATEPWEVDNARVLEKLGGAKYLGQRHAFELGAWPSDEVLAGMSRQGMDAIHLDGVHHIVSEINSLF